MSASIFRHQFSHLPNENTLFRNGRSKEELLRNTWKFPRCKSKNYRRKNRASSTNCGFIKREDSMADGLNFWTADFKGNVQALIGIHHTNNYRFDCGFVLKCFSNWPIFRILNSYCKMFDKRGPLGPINRLENWLAIPSNRLRGDRLAAKIIRFCFLVLYKGLCE